MYNTGHTATYKYKGTSQSKFHKNTKNKIYIDPMKREIPNEARTPLISENTVKSRSPKHARRHQNILKYFYILNRERE